MSSCCVEPPLRTVWLRPLPRTWWSTLDNTEQMAGVIKGHSTIRKVSWKKLPPQHCWVLALVEDWGGEEGGEGRGGGGAGGRPPNLECLVEFCCARILNCIDQNKNAKNGENERTRGMGWTEPRYGSTCLYGYSWGRYKTRTRHFSQTLSSLDVILISIELAQPLPNFKGDFLLGHPVERSARLNLHHKGRPFLKCVVSIKGIVQIAFDPSSVKQANVEKKCCKPSWHALTPPGKLGENAPNHPNKP